MTRQVGAIFSLMFVFILLFGASTARAYGYIYTVTVTTTPFLDPTVFSFTEPTISATGDVATLTQISGATALEFAWNSAASGLCSVNGIPVWFNGDACAAILEGNTNEYAGFAAGSFLAAGTYTNIDGGIAVSIVAAPEPSAIILLGSGLIGLAGAVRRRIRR